MKQPPGAPRLLIVEDDPQVREIADFAAQRTQRFGHVAFAWDGEDAMALLRRLAPEEFPDAILTDLAMPRMDGIQLVSWLKTEPLFRDIPVAMYSSSNLPNDEAHALAAGCRVFFQKPVSLIGLMDIFVAVADLAENVRA